MNFFSKNNNQLEDNLCELTPNDLEYELIHDEQKDDEFKLDIVELINYIIQLEYKPYYDTTEFNFIYQTTNDILEKYIFTNKINEEYLIIFMKLILHTRNPNGFSKTFASFVMLDVFNKFSIHHSHILLNAILTKIGCWKDVKRLYDYYYEYRNTQKSDLIDYSLSLMNNTLKEDEAFLNNGEYSKISYAAKWAPREKSKYNFLFCLLSKQYYKHYFEDSNANYKKALDKSKTLYRKLLSKLNKHLDTVEIKQCGKKWSKIDPYKQTNKNLKIYKNSFLNKSLTGETERFETSDRIICAYNFKEYYDSNSYNNILKTNLTKTELYDLINSQYFLNYHEIIDFNINY